MTSEDSQAFNFYVQGLLQYSALLLTATIGVFSPLTILTTAPLLGFWTKILLWFTYFIFTILSGVCGTKLAASFWSMHRVMPTPVIESRGKSYDLIFDKLTSRAKNTHPRNVLKYQWLILILIIGLYTVLALSIIL